jgi:hypothetical protein
LDGMLETQFLIEDYRHRISMQISQSRL